MSASAPEKRLIVGLGNPGRAYRHTPHNVGWDVVDRLADSFGFSWTDSKRYNAEIAEGLAGEAGPLCLMKPLTYMNLSGQAVAAWLRNKPLDLQQILVITDDVNLPMGKIRIRDGGSAGGHNGLKSLISCLGSEMFPRLRIGIDPGTGIYDLREFVLSSLPAREREWLGDSLGMAADAAIVWAREGCRAAMNKFNGVQIDPPA